MFACSSVSEDAKAVLASAAEQTKHMVQTYVMQTRLDLRTAYHSEVTMLSTAVLPLRLRSSGELSSSASE